MTVTPVSISKVHPFVRLSVRLSICPAVCLSSRMSVQPYVRPSVRLSVRLSICPAVCLSSRMSVRLFVCPAVCPAVQLSVRPSVHPLFYFCPPLFCPYLTLTVSSVGLFICQSTCLFVSNYSLQGERPGVMSVLFHPEYRKMTLAMAFIMFACTALYFSLLYLNTNLHIINYCGVG